MMNIVILVSIFTIGVGVKIPSNFHKCSIKNKDGFDDCVFEAARYGITQLTHPYDEVNIPHLDPFKLIESTINGGNGPVAVSQKFKNCDLYGLNKMQLEVFRFDFDKGTLAVDGLFPEIRKECDYEMKGRVLIIPVNGVGNSTITLKNLKIKSILHFHEKKKKGKTYIKFTSGDLDMDPELVVFNFLNHEDRRITEHLNPVLNENWREIFSDVKSGYIEIIKKILFEIVNNFFAKVSIEEAFNDE